MQVFGFLVLRLAYGGEQLSAVSFCIEIHASVVIFG
jgi:hypothetical protein